MFTGDDMIDLVWRIRIVFMQQTVLTPASRAIGDEPSNFLRNVTAQVCLRARALARMRRCSSCR